MKSLTLLNIELIVSPELTLTHITVTVKDDYFPEHD
jgi:hypothetical protein